MSSRRSKRLRKLGINPSSTRPRTSLSAASTSSTESYWDQRTRERREEEDRKKGIQSGTSYRWINPNLKPANSVSKDPW